EETMVKGDSPGVGDPHKHLSALDGWREFTTLSASTPGLLAGAEYAALGSGARAAHDEERLDYHTRLGVVGTSVLRQAVTTGRRLTLLNRHAISARRGLILSGAAGTGKTTAITQLGKTHEATDRARHPGRERIPPTFVYAGIDLERQGLFAGIRGSQIAGRFTLIPTLPFPLAGEWRGLVATIEDALRLRRHQAGTLAGLDRYLHQRTGGMIGSLSHLIRGASRRGDPVRQRADHREAPGRHRHRSRRPAGIGSRAGRRPAAGHA